MASPPTFTINPDPPTQGGKMEINYDFGESPSTSVTLRVTFDLPGGKEKVVKVSVTRANPSASVIVPSDASSGTIEDLSQQVTDLGFGILLSQGDG